MTTTTTATTTMTTPKMDFFQRQPSTPSTEKCLADELDERCRRVVDEQKEFARLEAEAEAEANLAMIAEAQAHQARLAEEEANRVRLEEQKRKDLERLQAQLAASNQPKKQAQPQKQPQAVLSPSQPQPPLKSPPLTKTPVIEKFTFLTKGRKHNHHNNSNARNNMRSDQLSPGLSPDYPPTISSAGGSTSDVSNRAVAAAEKKHAPVRSVTAPVGIEAGGKGIVPQTDAPASAINSGDQVSKEILDLSRGRSANLHPHPLFRPFSFPLKWTGVTWTDTMR